MACKRSPVRSRLPPPAKPFGNTQSPSSRGLGHRPFTAVTGVRIPVGTPNESKAAEGQLFSFGRPTVDENPEGFDNRVSGGQPIGRQDVLSPGGPEAECAEGCVDRGCNARRAQSPWGRQSKKPPTGGFFFARAGEREGDKAPHQSLSRSPDLTAVRFVQKFFMNLFEPASAGSIQSLLDKENDEDHEETDLLLPLMPPGYR